MSRLIVSLGISFLLAATAPPGWTQPAAQNEIETPAPSEPGPPPQTPAQPPPKEQPETFAPKADEPARTPPTDAAEPLTPEQFREQLVGVPLCGVPPSGPLAGKVLCTVHLPDGIAVVAGSGVLVRGFWEIADDRICRRSKDDPLERRRCVTYVKVSDGRYRNSDGVDVCLGPCGE